MPRTSRSPDAARVRTGLGLIAALATIALSAFFLDVAVRATAEGAEVILLADAAPGLRPGSPIWVAGRPAGRVLSIEFLPPRSDGHNILIRASLERNARPALRADARIEVKASDLVAPVVVSIEPGTGSLPPWDYADTLRTAGRSLDQDAVMALADSLLEAAERLRAVAAEARQTMANGFGSIQRLREEPEVLDGIQRDLGRLRDIMSESLPRSSLTKLASDTLIGPATRRIRERWVDWSDAPEREDSLRGLEAASGALDLMSARLERLLGKLQRGEGTAGRALMDGEIERQLEVIRATLAELSHELALDPSRWFRVRVF